MENYKLLVVDDVQVHRYLLQAGLGRINPFMRIDAANSVEEARQLLSGTSYDAVLCDWNMPGVSGSALLEWMRARPHFRYVPFIMVSSENNNEKIIDAFVQLGVDGYVVKPFQLDTLYQKVTEAIGKAKQKRLGSAHVPRVEA